MNKETMDRLNEEFHELYLRLGKLNKFISSDTFIILDVENQFLLKQQQLVMSQYKEILSRRICINRE